MQLKPIISIDFKMKFSEAVFNYFAKNLTITLMKYFCHDLYHLPNGYIL